MRRVPVFLSGAIVVVALGWILRPVPGGAPRRAGPGTLAATVVAPAIPAEAVSYADVLDIADADVLGDRWFLLDRRASRVHVLGPEPGSLVSFGRSGIGPGELTRPGALVLHGDTVVVVERLGGVLHRFNTAGRHLGDRRFEVGGCRVPVVSDAVSTPAGLVFLVTCPGVRLNTRAFAALERPGYDARVLASTAARPSPFEGIDPHFTPVLATHRDGIVFGAAGDECLSVMTLSGARSGVYCAGWLERLPLPEGDHEQLARLRVRMAAFGAHLKATDALPPFDGLFPVGPAAYAFRTPTRLGGASRQLHFAPTGPDRGARLPVARYAFAGRGTALLGWESAGGIRIARYDLPD